MHVSAEATYNCQISVDKHGHPWGSPQGAWGILLLQSTWRDYPTNYRQQEMEKCIGTVEKKRQKNMVTMLVKLDTKRTITSIEATGACDALFICSLSVHKHCLFDPRADRNPLVP